jgi:SAM-dependent methyltransferase
VSGDAYEPFIGRWSRLVAREFLDWLIPSPGLKWLDVGCGTGALSGTILANCSPAAVIGIDPSAEPLDEGRRFPLCRQGPLTELWQAAGLVDVTTQPTDVATIFRDFDDYWLPFFGGQGPAASYVAALDDGRRAAVRERVRQSLPHAKDGSIHLLARAWAVRGRRP